MMLKNIFSPRILRLCKSLGKINFLKNKICVTMLMVRTILMLCCINIKDCAFVTKLPRLNKCRTIISSSKITHSVWHNHTLSQGNKATKTVWGGGVVLDMKKRGEGRQYSGVFKKKKKRESQQGRKNQVHIRVVHLSCT